MEDTLRIAKKELERAKLRHKVYYDRKSKKRAFVEGDQVLVLLATDSNKLLMTWKGSFMMEEKVGDHDYRVNVNCKVKTYHVSLLKKFHQREGERDHISPSVQTGGAILEIAS